MLQISVECVVDICHLLVTGLRLGLPAEESDLFEKLEGAVIVSAEMKETLKRMKGFRNILVHEYTRVDDEITFDATRSRVHDFEEFQRQVLAVFTKI